MQIDVNRLRELVTDRSCWQFAWKSLAIKASLDYTDILQTRSLLNVALLRKANQSWTIAPLDLSMLPINKKSKMISVSCTLFLDSLCRMVERSEWVNHAYHIGSCWFPILPVSRRPRMWRRGELYTASLRSEHSASATAKGPPIASLSEFRSWKDASETGKQLVFEHAKPQ
jgi:hypothetical protein